MQQTPPASPSQGKKLLEQVSNAIRIKHYSTRTEQSYIDWMCRFILYHTFRHSFATHLLQNGGVYPERSRRDIRTVQELLGHKDVRTTMIIPTYYNAADWRLSRSIP